MVLNSTAKLFLKVLCLLLVSCSTTKETSRSLISDCIAEKNFRLSDTLDIYYFPPLRPCAGNYTQQCLVNSVQPCPVRSDTSQQRPFHARLIRHATANVSDTAHYQVNEKKLMAIKKQPPAPMLDTGRKIVLSLLIFFGFVFIGLVVLVIWKLLRLTGSQ